MLWLICPVLGYVVCWLVCVCVLVCGSPVKSALSMTGLIVSMMSFSVAVREALRRWSSSVRYGSVS